MENGSGKEGVGRERDLVVVEEEEDGRGSALSVLAAAASDMLFCVFHGPAGGVADRAQYAFRQHSPRLQRALHRLSLDITRWMKLGGPWRAFLVIVVGMILLVAASGLGAFVVVFAIATVNVVAVGLLASIASVGAFAALFFSFLTAIYLGALAIAIFVISTIAFCCICATLVAAGWVAFGWVVWQGISKGLDFTRGSLMMAASAVGTMSSASSA